MWERWPATNDDAGRLRRRDRRSHVRLARRRISAARLADPPTDLDALVALPRRRRRARRRHRPARVRRRRDAALPDPGPLATIDDDDPRLAALEDAADRAEWLESSADEPCATRVGVVERDGAPRGRDAAGLGRHGRPLRRVHPRRRAWARTRGPRRRGRHRPGAGARSRAAVALAVRQRRVGRGRRPARVRAARPPDVRPGATARGLITHNGTGDRGPRRSVRASAT